MSAPSYFELLEARTVVFDGAMGTSIQSRSPSTQDFGREGLVGCHDHLVLTRPDLIREIHASFLEVGCDVVETNTFRANRFALADYGLQAQVLELNQAAAQVAGEAAAAFTGTGRPRYVAGSMGPSGFLPSSSDPELGRIGYQELVDVYREQAQGLLEGGVDLLLVETGQDILEVKASVTGVRKAMADAGRRVPLQVQVTLDTSGRMLLGTSMPSAMVTLEALGVDVLGLNCSTGPEPMRGPIRFLSEHGRTPISVIPNAGIPENLGGEAVYPLTPDQLAKAHRDFVETMGVAAVGGCCGTTPEHIRAVVEALDGVQRHGRPVGPGLPRVSSGVKAVEIAQSPAPTFIGERVNAQGSRKVKELLLAEDYEGILQIARNQVEGGAHILDVCTAVTERPDEADQMQKLVRLLSQGVEAPLMVDTTEVEVVIAALRQVPGRATLNSIHLEGGREKVDRLLPHVVEHGAALVALTIDESGMAKTAEEKVAVAKRIRGICCDEYGLAPSDLIFDALTFTLATGEEEYRTSAMETLEGIRRIKEEIPGCFASLGVSNVSFGLQRQARPVLNSVFLHHAVEAGLDLAILNPALITPFYEIDETERTLAEDLIFCRRPDALPKLIAHFEGRATELKAQADPRDTMGPAEAIHWMVLHRMREGVESLVDETIGDLGGGHHGAVRTLNEVLLPAMKEVGDLFGAGELILPFVLQSAEVMKLAVAHLEESLERVEGQSKGTVVLATVLGDVHDIGKNLVHTILENNGFTVHNLGKQVPISAILQQAQELEADAIGLSALLVSTSKQMPLCVQELHRRGLEIPVLLGGAAINPSFVRKAAEVPAPEGRKAAEAPAPEERPADEDGGPSSDHDGPTLYPHGVFYCKDAFDGLAAMESLVDEEKRALFLSDWARTTREKTERREVLVAEGTARRSPTRRPPPSRGLDIPKPPLWGSQVLESLPLEELLPLIDLNTLYRLHWGAKNAKGEALERLVAEEFEPRLRRLQAETLSGDLFQVSGAYGFYPAVAEGNDLLLLDPDDQDSEIGRFPFPRQEGRDGICLADFFSRAAERNRAEPGPAWHVAPVREAAPIRDASPLRAANPLRDVAPLQIVTVKSPILEEAVDRFSEGDYSDTYFLHGFGVRLAEAGAEFLHQRIRRELGIDSDRGLRYSWGYGACPDPRQHETVFSLLPARQRLGMDLTEAGALVPELSTAALVVHHPEARYFSV